MELDVCDDASVDRAVSEIEKTAGTVDVLVNNAGIAIAAVMEEITLADLRKQFETNYFGLVRMSQRVLPGMRRKLSGRIINMSSIAGKLVSPLFGPYSSSKHAVEAVSDAMRLEVYPFGIQVVLIEPGYIPTSMNRNAGELSSAYAKGAEQSPYKAVYQGFLNAWGKTTKSSHYTAGRLRAGDSARGRRRSAASALSRNSGSENRHPVPPAAFRSRDGSPNAQDDGHPRLSAERRKQTRENNCAEIASDFKRPIRRRCPRQSVPG